MRRRYSRNESIQMDSRTESKIFSVITKMEDDLMDLTDLIHGATQSLYHDENPPELRQIKKSLSDLTLRVLKGGV